MKHALIAVALCLAFVAPVSAASKYTPKPYQIAYAITDNRRVLTVYPKGRPDDHFIAGLDNLHRPANEQWFRVKNGFVPFSTYRGVPVVADTGLYIPDTSMMVADTMSGGFLRDSTTGALVVSSGAAGLPISGVFNSTAPIITNGQSSSLQVTSAGELITAQGGKTYVSLAEASTACFNLFSIPIRLVEIDNPGVAQTHVFVLYDEATNACTGFSLFGNTHANEATGPLIGAGQYISIGVRATNGISLAWFVGEQGNSTPYIQVQMIFPFAGLL